MTSKRLFDYLYYQQEHHPLTQSVGRRHGKGWLFYSTEELIEKSKKLASGLIKLGVEKGDKVAIVSYKNRPEWLIADLATQYIGAVSIPLYPTISSSDYRYILDEADVKVAIAGSGDLYDKLQHAWVDTMKYIITMDKSPEKLYWEDISNEEHMAEVESSMAGIKPEDLVTIIYTSGTTGNPKGVMLTHANIDAAVVNTCVDLPFTPGENSISFLPFCHIFERAVIYAYLWNSCKVHCTGTDNLGGENGDLADVKPHMFTTVPRLLEKVYEKIFNKGMELKGAKRKLFFWSLSLADKYEMEEKGSPLYRAQLALANKLVFSKWRAALGGHLRGIVTGAAPCPARIARVFSAAGIPIIEAYGLTETSPTLTINRYGGKGAKIGTVGPAIQCVELKLDTNGDYKEGEGEILASGPNIMQGYYKKPKETAAVLEEIDGKTWFRTGDIGKYVDGPHGLQYLKITDRKKELLKTSGGKYVAPAPIESKYKEDFLIEQIMVVGDKQKFVSALIVPAVEPLQEWCNIHNVPWTNLKEMLQHPKVVARYQQCCDKYNPLFSHIEQVKKFTLLDRSWDFTTADGSAAELTPTMKLKRRVIRDKYADEIAGMYAEA